MYVVLQTTHLQEIQLVKKKCNFDRIDSCWDIKNVTKNSLTKECRVLIITKKRRKFHLNFKRYIQELQVGARQYRFLNVTFFICEIAFIGYYLEV